MCNNFDLFKEEKKIFHYCSLESFVSIVKNKQLWLSRIDNTNDKYDMKYVDYKIRKIVEELISDGTISKEIGDDITALYSDDEWYAKRYIGCFSRTGDNLNQWRFYGDDANGVSIGFSLAKLRSKNNIDSKSVLQAGYVGYKVKYFDKKEEERIVEEIKNMCTNNQENHYKFSIEDIIHFKENNYVKSEDFKYEDEYRILYQPQQKRVESERLILDVTDEFYKKEELDYRIQKEKIVPYWKMPIDGCISEVIIGSKCNTYEIDMKKFLEKYDFNNVDVRKSEASYQ